MAISRLFVEIGKDVDRLNSSLREAMQAGEKAGVTFTASGQRMVAAFDKALRPTADLGEQIQLLQKAGKSSAEIWKVYEGRVTEAVAAQKRMGTAIDPTVSALMDQNKAAQTSRLNFETLGRSIQSFAANPLQAARGGMTSLMQSMGPFAVAVASVGAAAVLAGKQLFDMGAAAAAEAERLNNLSISTGLSTQKIQALAQISKEAGIEGMDLAKQFGQLNQQLGRPEGGDFTKALIEAGIALEDNSGKTKDAIALLDELRANFSQIADPAKRAQEMHAALGGRLRDLIPLLMSSNVSLAEQIKIMEKTGPVWDDITQQKLMQFDSALDKISRTWSSFVTDIKAGVGSVLGSLSGLVTQTDTMMNRMSEEQRVQMALASQPGFKITPMPGGPFTSVNAESLLGAPKIARDVFVAQQQLIAQGADHLDLRMQIAAAQREFNNLINKGTNDQLAAQARVLGALNEQLKIEHDIARERAGRKTSAQIMAEQSMSDLELVTTLQKLCLKQWQEQRAEAEKFSLDLPKKIKADEFLQAPKDSFDELRDSMDQVGQAFEHYRSNLISTQEALRAFYVAQTEASLVMGKGGFTDIATVAIGKFVEDFEGIPAGLADSFGQFFDTMASGFARAITDSENLGEALKDIGKTAITGLISSLIRLGIQWAIHKALMSSIDKGAIAAQAAQASATATMWAPAAAMVSLATLGQNAGPAMTSIGLTNALALSVASLSKLGGFKEGGYTGLGDPDRIAGIVHGQEFVMNRAATKEYLPLLEMLNSNRERIPASSGSAFAGLGRPAVNIHIANYGTAKDFEVTHLDEGTIRIIARDEARNVLHQAGPEVIASDLAYANSKTSKALAKHTTARRMDR